MIMPDVGVKLNIEAEGKQALATIATLGKALDAVQGKARNITAGAKQNEQSTPQNVKNESLAAAQKETAEAVRETAQQQEKLAVAKKEEAAATQQLMTLNAAKSEQDEKDRFAMEVSLLNMGQLIEKLKELQAAREEAARVGDAEAFQRLTGQFNAAREQMEKINVQLNLGRLAYAQQMQVANSFAGSLKGVGSMLGNMGDAAKEGELDLVGLAGGIQQTAVSFQMMKSLGMGWVGMLTLALQGLQSVWNSYAQGQKKVAEAEAENAKILENEKALYEELKTARAEYDAQVQLAQSLQALNTEYDGIKNKLQDSLNLINESTKAEMVRLSLLKTEGEFARLQERYELGRAFKRGDISEEDYQKQLLILERAQQTAAAEQKAEEQKIQRSQKEAEKDLKFEAYQTAQNKLSAAEAAAKGFNVSDAEISAYESKISEQQKNAEERTSRAIEAMQEIGVRPEIVDEILRLGYIPETIKTRTGATMRLRDKNGNFADSDFLNVEYLLKGRQAALESSSKLQAELTASLGGRSVEQYKFDKAENKQLVDFLTQQVDAARSANEAAMSSFYTAPSLAIIEAEKNRALREINFHTSQKMEDLQTDTQLKQAAQQRADELSAARNVVGSMSGKQILRMLANLTPSLSSSNKLEREQAEALSEVYRAEQSRREAALTLGQREIMRDRVVNEADAVYIARGLKSAAESGSKAEKELYTALVDYTKKQIKTEKERKAFTKKVKEEIAR